MRTIKFRAWDYTAKVMTRVFSIWKIKGFTPTDIRDMKLMQFTGLKDKDGKEIYEGDIITCRDGKGVIVYIERFAKFVMDFNYFGRNSLPDFEDAFSSQDADTCMRSIKVIGNIYENTELLVEEEK